MSRRDVSGPEGGLSNNPFGALKGRFASSGEKRADTAPAAESAARDSTSVGRIVVRFERKGRGGRTVTRASGISAARSVLGDPEEAVRRARRALGVGAHLEDDDLVVQGECVERLAKWLEGQGVSEVVRGNGRVRRSRSGARRTSPRMRPGPS